MAGKHTEPEALSRLLRIDWSRLAKPETDIHAGSNFRLTSEFLRRMTIWGELLHADRWPWINVARSMFPLENHAISEIEVFSNAVSKYGLDFWVRSPCIWYLQWNSVRQRGEILEFKLPDPYEPLILSFERGNSLSQEHGIYLALSGGQTIVIDDGCRARLRESVDKNHLLIGQ
jgi:hypothetical protein